MYNIDMANPADDMRGLPIQDLISAPLISAANSQGQLAMVTADFIQKVGITQNGEVRTVEFKYEDTNEDGETIQKKLDVPLLSVVNIPSLSVKSVDVNFTMEVKTQSVDKSSTESNTKVEASYGGSWWCPVKCKMSGSVATKSENTRSSDKSAKYDIKVCARDDGMPEGLSRVLDIISGSISNNASKKTEKQVNSQ
jgi:hypothetical protein